MPKTVGKVWSMFLIAAVSAVGIVALESESTPAEAANAAWFNPGQIISDSAFYTSGTMSLLKSFTTYQLRVELAPRYF